MSGEHIRQGHPLGLLERVYKKNPTTLTPRS
jgi:hypothetical protein